MPVLGSTSVWNVYGRYGGSPADRAGEVSTWAGIWCQPWLTYLMDMAALSTVIDNDQSESKPIWGSFNPESCYRPGPAHVQPSGPSRALRACKSSADGWSILDFLFGGGSLTWASAHGFSRMRVLFSPLLK